MHFGEPLMPEHSWALQRLPLTFSHRALLHNVRDMVVFRSTWWRPEPASGATLRSLRSNLMLPSSRLILALRLLITTSSHSLSITHLQAVQARIIITTISEMGHFQRQARTQLSLAAIQE